MASSKKVFPVFDKQNWSKLTQKAEKRSFIRTSDPPDSPPPSTHTVNNIDQGNEDSHNEEEKTEPGRNALATNSVPAKKKRVNYAKGSPAERMRTAVN
jgi:hypothetical protein